MGVGVGGVGPFSDTCPNTGPQAGPGNWMLRAAAALLLENRELKGMLAGPSGVCPPLPALPQEIPPGVTPTNKGP